MDAATILRLILMFFKDVLYDQPAPVVKIYDCRKVDYCPCYSNSCIRHYKEVGGTNNYSQLVAKYPCCLCSSKNNDSCVCGRGGYVIRDLTLKLPQNDPTIQIGTYLIVTEYTGFKPRVEKCINDSDCVSGKFCTKKCHEFKGNKTKLNQHYRCCSCGPPVSDGCDNCSCATHTTYARFRVDATRIIKNLRLGIFQVSISEGPLLTTSRSSPELFYELVKTYIIPS